MMAERAESPAAFGGRAGTGMTGGAVEAEGPQR
jgi:hypothetical protein